MTAFIFYFVKCTEKKRKFSGKNCTTKMKNKTENSNEQVSRMLKTAIHPKIPRINLVIDHEESGRATHFRFILVFKHLTFVTINLFFFFFLLCSI